MDYKPYPNKKITPSRKNRKGARSSIFLANKALSRQRRKLRRQEKAQKAEGA